MPQEWVRSGSNLAERSREFQQFVKFWVRDRSLPCDNFYRQLLQKMKVAVLVLALAALVHADIYLHNPRQVYMCTVNNICELSWLRACM